VRAFLGFIGITDVEFVYAEGLALSESSKQASIAQAHREIGYITAPEAIAA
jgi:FMN-dependent NADH-azoreductase